jgi:protein TonB
MGHQPISWLSSLALHGGALACLGVAVGMTPTQLEFHRGKTSIELQASIAAALASDDELPARFERHVEPSDIKPVRLQPEATAVERKPAKLVESEKPADVARPDADPFKTAVAVPNRCDELLQPKPVDMTFDPPQRAINEANTHDLASPVVSAAVQDSQAESGITYEELPQPNVLNRQPAYPPDAYALRQQGTVVLHLQVTDIGIVSDVRIARSSGVISLDEAAVEAARSWRFTPARRGGTRVATAFETRVNFRIGR